MGQAIQLFERTIAANPNPTITAWSHIYLGRIRYLSGDLNKANEQFKLALAITALPPKLVKPLNGAYKYFFFRRSWK